ncbi:MAG: carboxypeptidase-like regulatory domain-containing protein, partial [Muribaculaceae bacterium]|nr:carboxypeptidase-like regulatory domain-containing protein [Muribaculaceae bacterium]
MNRKPWKVRAAVLSLLWTIALIAVPGIRAQLLTVSGTVYDSTGDVLIGVSVSVKGDQKHGMHTDIEGNYSLSEVPSDATLIFSYVGFGAVEEKVNG